MKNLFKVIAIIFVFTSGVFAQNTKKYAPEELAKNELQALLKVIELDESIALSISNLLLYKHEMVGKNPENKEEIAQIIEHKLKSTITDAQFQKVKNNKVLFEDLIY